MKVFSTTQLRRKTMAILEVAQCEPVTITWYGKPRFVLMSHEHFELMQPKLDLANESEEIDDPC
jgi:prevent-host-death family protein